MATTIGIILEDHPINSPLSVGDIVYFVEYHSHYGNITRVKPTKPYTRAEWWVKDSQVHWLGVVSDRSEWPSAPGIYDGR